MNNLVNNTLWFFLYLPFVFCVELMTVWLKGTVSPAKQCDLVGVKLEKVHELFQVCRICGKGVGGVL